MSRAEKRFKFQQKRFVTCLEKPAADWPAFLNEVDKSGLKREDLVIGLKAKERELKSISH